MKLISYDPNDLSLKTYLSFSPQLIFSGNNVLILVPTCTYAPQFMPKAYVEGGYCRKQPCRGSGPIVGIVNLDSWNSHELRVDVIRNNPEIGVERIKRKKEQNRSD